MVEWVCTLFPLDVIPVYCYYIKIYRRFISYNTSILFGHPLLRMANPSAKDGTPAKDGTRH